MLPAASGERWWHRRPGWAGAVVVGVVATLLAVLRVWHEPAVTTDFDQFHFAARALLRGENPYAAVGPGRAFEWGWPLNYPLPSVLLVVPLAWLPVEAGRVAFAAAAGAVLGYALCRRGELWRLGVVLSAAFLIAIRRSQWSPFLVAAFTVPWAAVFPAAKPNFVVPVLAGASSWRRAAGLAAVGAAAAAAALLWSPSWPLEWFRVLRQMPFVSAPVVNPGGALILLALLRWRRPEARVLAALACMPQTPSLYDLLPLVVVPRTRTQLLGLSLCTTILFFVIVALGPFATFNDYVHALERWAVFLVYLPAVAMVLRRPNVSEPLMQNAAPARTGSLRGWVEALPRPDALLLLAAAFSALFLVWLTLATPQP